MWGFSCNLITIQNLAFDLSHTSTRDFTRALDLDLVRSLTLALDYARVLARGSSLTQVFGNETNFDLGLIPNLEQILEQVLRFSQMIALDRALVREFLQKLSKILSPQVALNLTYSFSSLFIFDIHLKFDFDLFSIWQIAALISCTVNTSQLSKYANGYNDYFYSVLEQSQRLGSSNLTQALAELSIPSAKNDQNRWREFADDLFRLINTRYDIRYLCGLDSQQTKKLVDYLYEIELIIQCLKLAAISDRRSIEDSLLLPPQTTLD